MKKTHTLWLAAGLVLLASTSLHAGQKLNGPVYLTSTSASGSLGSVRNSADDKQYIYCWVQATADDRSGQCVARDATGLSSRSCFTWDPLMVETIAALHGDSRLFFVFDSGGNCTSISTSAGSWHEPKQ